jgi:hypothetical protein
MIEIMNLTIRVPEILLYLISLIFSGLKFLLIGIFGIGLLQRFVSWISQRLRDKNAYFPFNWSSCAWVYDNKSKWWQKAKEFLTRYPKHASVVGFFSILIWPLLICLNVLLLAQVLELFFSGGKRIPLPLVGTYSVFPLIMGILYATTQTLLGILHGHSNSKWGKVGFIIILGLMIIVEAGLTAYRAWLLSTGEEPVAPTLVDIIMAKGGIVLGGMLGFFVPLAEAISGRVGFLNFIEPIIKTSLFWFAGVMISIWGIVVWWVCGFYSEKPTPPAPSKIKVTVRLPNIVDNLNKDVDELKGQVNKLNEDVDKLQKQMALSEKLNKIKNFSNIKQKVESVKNTIDTAGYDNRIEKIYLEINQIQNRNSLNQLLQDIRKTKKKIVDFIQDEVRYLEEKVIKFIEIDKFKEGFDKFRADYEDKCSILRNDLNNLNTSPRIENIRKQAEDIRCMLMETQQSVNGSLSPMDKNELTELLKRANMDKEAATSESELRTIENATNILNECQNLTNNILNDILPNIKHNLENINNAIIKLSKNFDEYNQKIENLPISPYREVEKVFITAYRNINRYKKEFDNLEWRCIIKRFMLLFLPSL